MRRRIAFIVALRANFNDLLATMCASTLVTTICTIVSHHAMPMTKTTLALISANAIHLVVIIESCMICVNSSFVLTSCSKSGQSRPSQVDRRCRDERESGFGHGHPVMRGDRTDGGRQSESTHVRQEVLEDDPQDDDGDCVQRRRVGCRQQQERRDQGVPIPSAICVHSLLTRDRSLVERNWLGACQCGERS